MLMPDELTGGGSGVGSGGEEKGFDTDSALEQIGNDLFGPAATPEEPKPAREYTRSEDGKFAPASAALPVKDGKVTPGGDNTIKETVQTPAAAPGAATPEGKTLDPSVPQGLQPPSTWTKDALALWAQTPPRVQAEILKRETDMFKGLQQYRDAAQVGQTFAKTLEPFVPALQKLQLNPSELLKRALTAHLNLTLSPLDVKMKLFRGLAADYGIDLNTLLDDVPYEPEISQETLALKQEVAQLREALTGIHQHNVTQRKTAILADVNTFAENPENIYFEELADDITQLLAQGVAADLKTAYEKAIWLNPTVREKELARQVTARQAKAAEEEAARLAAAKKASSANVRTQARPASALDPASTGDMEETVKEQLRAIRNRG